MTNTSGHLHKKQDRRRIELTDQGRDISGDLDHEIARVPERFDPAEQHADAASPDKTECAI